MSENKISFLQRERDEISVIQHFYRIFLIEIISRKPNNTMYTIYFSYFFLKDFVYAKVFVCSKRGLLNMISDFRFNSAM